MLDLVAGAAQRDPEEELITHLDVDRSGRAASGHGDDVAARLDRRVGGIGETELHTRAHRLAVQHLLTADADRDLVVTEALLEGDVEDGHIGMLRRANLRASVADRAQLAAAARP